MKRKLVLWGRDEQDARLLIGLELLEKENKVNIHTIPEKVATEDFYNEMMKKWRDGETIDFPEGSKMMERPLSVTESILPDELRADRTDIINRAKTEWHFVVLSSKMHEMYASELEELKERIDNLQKYDKGIWDEMKQFWGKVQEQVNEQNLFREHGNTLRSKTNELFTHLKDMKSDLEKEFKSQSKVVFADFSTMLDNVEEKINKNLGLKPIFEELKDIQKKFKGANFTRDDGNKIWKRMDTYFKTVKEKRFGDAGKDQSRSGNEVDRIKRRYDGLMSAINKMQSSIGRDKSEMVFQERKISTTDGQLESEIRQAKVQMIKQRVVSKDEKLQDMLRTKVSLEKKMEQEQKKMDARAEKQKVNAAKNQIKEKISKDIEAAAASRKEQEGKLKKAADDVKASKTKDTPKGIDKVAGAEKTIPPVAIVNEAKDEEKATIVPPIVEKTIAKTEAVKEVVEKVSKPVALSDDENAISSEEE